jgi:hypothetical protein
MTDKLDPNVTGNVALVLNIQLMAHLMKHKKITQQDVSEIFQHARARYKTNLLPPPSPDWTRQAEAVLAMAHNDVLQFGTSGT